MSLTTLKKPGQRGTLWQTFLVDPGGSVIDQSWRDTGKAPRKATVRHAALNVGPDPEAFIAEKVKVLIADGWELTNLPPDVPLKLISFAADLEESDLDPLLSRAGLYWLATDIADDPTVLPAVVAGFKVNPPSAMNRQVIAEAAVEPSALWSDLRLQRLATFFVTVNPEAKLVDGDEVQSLLKMVVVPGVRSRTWDPDLQEALVALGLVSAPLTIAPMQSETPFTVCL